MDSLRANNGALTINPADRSQRNLFLSLERLASVGTVARVVIEGRLATYRLPGEQGV